MNFALQAGFPIFLLIAPMFLVGQSAVINVIGFTSGIAMAILALGSTGFRAALGGGAREARFYVWMATGLSALAGFTMLFVNSYWDSLGARPVAQAQVSIMPSVFWGSAAGFLLAAVWTWLRKRPT